jgi:carbonic anhydrase
MKARSLILVLIFVLPILLMAAEPATVGFSRDEVLSRLVDGNVRYAAAEPQKWNAGADKRHLLADGQHPMACVVTCSDSRVSPEILFDQSIGDLFVVRVAGNVPSAEVVQSVEYAVAHLKVPVVIVMGHTSCGAVNAACNDAEKSPVPAITDKIEPAVMAAKHSNLSGAQLADKVSEINARLTAMALLEQSSVISAAVNDHQTSLMSAIYSLNSGSVSFQTELAAVSLPKAKPAAEPLQAAKAGGAKLDQPAAKPQVAKAAIPKAEQPAVAQKSGPSGLPLSIESLTAKKDSTIQISPKKKDSSASYARRSR